ncbi:hypothetical protein DYBT9275_04106 [Dyadobacter sp. CECT 9275]|uniref:Uncharacterized protein n=1 Tax=Dyadobacter helix TaxID=2822344 RepID=A0A916JEQ3_9BACT|nr:hypothetical protein [Dyadobacter sp. CECT 9275]CAG5007698.1 hypothetical protein DYBT9275_04106 [Dyadobacter sp. CECT 9275]
MISKKNRKYLFLAFLILIGYIVYDTASLPSINDLKSGFTEVAAYRNKNNTGPIIRIYAVSVKEHFPDEIQKYGDLMPHTKYGETTVYFFQAQGEIPKNLTPGNVNFDTKYNANCIARYRKDAMGQVSVVKKPFLNKG